MMQGSAVGGDGYCRHSLNADYPSVWRGGASGMRSVTPVRPASASGIDSTRAAPKIDLAASPTVPWRADSTSGVFGAWRRSVDDDFDSVGPERHGAARVSGCVVPQAECRCEQDAGRIDDAVGKANRESSA